MADNNIIFNTDTSITATKVEDNNIATEKKETNQKKYSSTGLELIGNVTIRYMKDEQILDQKVIPLYGDGVIFLTSIKMSYNLSEVWLYESAENNSRKYALTQDDDGYSRSLFKDNDVLYLGGDPLVILEDYHAHEIIPNLHLGNVTAASNIHFLRKRNITHILTVAKNLQPRFPQSGIKYKIIPVWDEESEDLLSHFPECNTFIDSAITSGGTILVHCAAGVSRSATVVIAYLMKQNQWTVEQAKDFVFEKRNCIYPNEGFINQLHWYHKSRYEILGDYIPNGSHEVEIAMSNKY